MTIMWPHYAHITAEERGDVALITLNRPAAANALSSATVTELADAVGIAGRDTTIRCVVLTGSGGKVFCAGADLKERHANPGKDWELRRPLLKF